ncbi:hypothetical protein QE152_g6902 [Popillia japonica]|uniref:Uncharacterized protein n=1 Tax=Popillia japonica TaxID=7064 RepID=A0AAW1MHF2_POPJA
MLTVLTRFTGNRHTQFSAEPKSENWVRWSANLLRMTDRSAHRKEFFWSSEKTYPSSQANSLTLNCLKSMKKSRELPKKILNEYSQAILLGVSYDICQIKADPTKEI